TLALKPADLPPDERERLHAHLATCPGCAATYADYQSLITRLRALPRPALPPLGPLATDLLAEPATPEQLDGLYDIAGDAWLTPPASESAPPTRLPPSRRRTWLQRLSTLAAVLLLTVLVGALVAVLLHRTQGVALPPEKLFQLRPGWSALAEYSGTGSQTITGQDIELPRLWGNAYGCIGSGKLDIELSGKSASEVYGMSTIGCDTASFPLVSPGAFSFDNTPIGKLDTIKVTTSAKTHWFFQLTQAIEQPAFVLGPEWAIETNIGADGNGRYQWDGGLGRTAYKIWGLVFTCFGSGSGSVELTPGVGKINIPPCTGQPTLVKARYPSATSLQAADVVFTGDAVWNILLVGCVDEQQCAQD
ncbi:MAG TPA: zf-HC2 domain-containing protein, partial [Ktedonobacterales bacterium]|nr:zf-HC2 domain-containing protein [Ktedonobacterales bacterium]